MISNTCKDKVTPKEKTAVQKVREETAEEKKKSLRDDMEADAAKKRSDDDATSKMKED